ncbi:unnamed protein product [Polarella glacialis]|uniref:Transmembrane protein n=1 Tax=Polarella glacialis TaxID=89957 RepID=A0A813FME8_POLGL|nr:unnamed protein product [Polarella glacialis]
MSMYGQPQYGIQPGYGTTMGGDQMGMPYKQQGQGFAALAAEKQSMPGVVPRRRLNVVAACLCLFVPWLLFCFTSAIYSFSVHYYSPALVYAGSVVVSVILGSARYLLGENFSRDGFISASWVFFLLVTCLAAFVLGIAFGNYNFYSNMQVYYDVTNLNSYVGVDPATMRGQELMDAGRVEFVAGTQLDLKHSVGFKNMDVYCVAPIIAKTGVLATYDFFAVGKNCCSEDAADFKCGAYSNKYAHAGLRVVNDADRDFYRLAVQQAESTFAIKAVHPLFLYWTDNASSDTEAYSRAGYQWLLVVMFAYFAFQLTLVFLATSCFTHAKSLL